MPRFRKSTSSSVHFFKASTASNTVVVTVSNVAGLTITPDAGSDPTVVAGETLVLYNFTVTNTGNFINQVQFLASGASD